MQSSYVVISLEPYQISYCLAPPNQEMIARMSSCRRQSLPAGVPGIQCSFDLDQGNGKAKVHCDGRPRMCAIAP